MSKQQLLTSFPEWIGGTTVRRTISSNQLEVDVVTNEDFDESRLDDENSGFLFYRYYLDIEPNPAVSEAEYVGSIRKLLKKLKDEGLRAVASCDFEHLLAEVS
jgi:hypothetical protein